jgi:hypothetical protein
MSSTQYLNFSAIFTRHILILLSDIWLVEVNDAKPVSVISKNHVWLRLAFGTGGQRHCIAL